MMKKFTIKKSLAILLSCITALSFAQDNTDTYPSGDIDVIVAFRPGGGTDVAARTIQPFIEKYLDKSLIILNKPGAGGEIGFSLLASSKPDGYTMGFINLPAMFAYSYTRETAYTPESFEAVANLVYDPNVIAVNSSSKIMNLGDLIKEGLDAPGKFTIGTSGSVGSSEHIAILQVQAATNSVFNHVPFGGTAQLRTALLGGHIPAGGMSLSEAIEYQEEGNIRILGVMAKERSELAPEIPTFAEQGVNIVTGSSRGLAFPAGTPKEIVNKMSVAIEKAMSDPEYMAQAEKLGVPLNYMDADEYSEFLKDTNHSLSVAWDKHPWQMDK